MSREIRVITPVPVFMEDVVPADILAAGCPDYLEDVEMVIVELDGPAAAHLLTFNKEPELGVKGSNRKSLQSLIEEMAAEILAGEWHFSHQGIGFDRYNLVDGAHRLKALRLAAQTKPDIRVPFVIVTGMPDEAMGVIDSNRRRSLSNMLTMKGYANVMQLSAVGRLMYLFSGAQFDKADRVYWSNARPTRRAVRQYIDANHGLLSDGLRVANRSRLLTPASTAAAWCIITRKPHDAAKVEAFFDQLLVGEHIGRGDPAFAVRRFAENARSDKGPMVDTYIQLAVVLKAWLKFRDGKPWDMAAFRDAVEIFPNP